MPDPPLPTEPSAADRAFGSYVAACADALARGAPLPPPPSADLAARCAKAQATLRLLDRFRHQPAEGPIAPTGPRPGGRIGRYEIIREVGRGGMGVVYLARDPDLDRTVALKVVVPADGDPERWLARLHAEGRLLAKLEHANIVRVYKAGGDGGRPFLVMEYVDGPSLHHHLGGNPLPPAAAAALVEAVARAVDYAHRNGVVHRDLKPANILLAGGGVPKVTDFGLATTAGRESGLTRTGELIGTPSYLAPEVVAGAAAVGPEVDVYGLGTILYECLTGRPPFAAANLALTLVQVQYADPVPPRQINPAVPRDLETICLTCLRKEAARRYPSAADVADDLAAFRAGRPIHARPVGSVEAAVKWARRNRTAAILAAAAVVALVGGTAGSLYFAVVANDRAGRANAAQADAVAAKRASDLLAARLRFQEAVRQAEAGDVADGLAGMAEALRLAPTGPDADDLRRVIRLNFTAWGRQVAVLRYAVRPWGETPRDPWVRPVGPEGATVAAWAVGHPVRFLDAGSGRPVGNPWALPADECPLALSADGELLLCRIGDEKVVPQIRLRWRADGTPVGTPITTPNLPGRGSVPDRLSFVLSGRAVMTGGMNTAPWWGPRRFWDLEAGVQHPLVVSDERLAAVRLVAAADGRAVAVVVRYADLPEGAAGRAEFWDVATAQPLDPAARLDDRTDPHVHAGGRAIAMTLGTELGRPDGLVAWWEVGTGRFLGQWKPGRGGRLSDLTPDAQAVVGVGRDEKARVYDPDAGLQRGGDLPLPEGAADPASPGVFLAGPVLLTLAADGVLRGHDVRHFGRQATTSPARPWERPAAAGRAAAPFPAAAVSPGGRYALLSAGGRGGYGRLVETATGEPVGPPLLPQPYRSLIAFTPDERTVATGSYNFWVGGPTEVHLYDTATARPIAPPISLSTYVHGLTASPDGRTVAVARLRATTLVDAATGRAVYDLPEKTCVGAAAFHPDGTRLIVAGRTGWGGPGAGVRLWNPTAGEPLTDFQAFEAGPPIPSLLLLDGGRTALAYGRGSRTTAVLDTATGTVRLGPQPTSQVWTAAACGGTVVAFGSADGRVGRWDVATGEAVGPVLVQPAPVVALEYDGRLLAVAAADRAVRLWDAATGLPVGPALMHIGEVTAVRFAADAPELVTTTAAGEVRRWPLPDPAPDDADAMDAWVATASGRAAGRTLDPSTWAEQCGRLDRLWPAGEAALTETRSSTAAGAAWHHDRARDAEAAGNAKAAAWHLTRLAESRPDDWHAAARLADALTRIGNSAGAKASDEHARRLGGFTTWGNLQAHRAALVEGK